MIFLYLSSYHLNLHVSNQVTELTPLTYFIKPFKRTPSLKPKQFWIRNNSIKSHILSSKPNKKGIHKLTHRNSIQTLVEVVKVQIKPKKEFRYFQGTIGCDEQILYVERLQGSYRH